MTLNEALHSVCGGHALLPNACAYETPDQPLMDCSASRWKLYLRRLQDQKRVQQVLTAGQATY